MRSSSHVIETVQKLIDENLDSGAHNVSTDSKGHPLKQLILNGSRIEYYDEEDAKVLLGNNCNRRTMGMR